MLMRHGRRRFGWLGLALVVGLSASAGAAAQALRTAPSVDLSGRSAFEVDGNIWVMSADGSHRVRLTTTPESDFDLSWSPDGTQIVFRTSRGAYASDPQGIGTEGIFVINADGSSERQLWPPDAQTPGGLFPDWSPAGDRIAFSGVNTSGRETVYTIRPDGSGLVDLGMMGEGIEWSPDGTKVMFNSHTGDGDWQIWVMNADGSAKTQLTTAPAVHRGGPGGNHTGAWSPDTTQIVFQSDRAGDYDVYLMDADGANQRLVITRPGSQAPSAWLPDGRLVVADWSTGKNLPDWSLVNTDGTELMPLPQLQGANAPLDWLP